MSTLSPSQGQAWHDRPAAAALASLGTGDGGLSDEEAARRRDRYGPNRIPQPARRGPLRRFLGQFHNLLIYVLLGAAAITASLGHWIDTNVILGVVVLNAVIGFVQEGKAEKALQAIRKMLSARAAVIRGGRRLTIPAQELVPGDLVTLESGDKVPADMRLVRVKGLQVQEASLTGESVPVPKDIAPVQGDAALGDRTSMAYSGTLVASGQATGVVVATGADMEIGRISSMLADVESLTTPLLRQMTRFSAWLTAGILGLGAVVFAFGLWVRDYDAGEMFMAVVGLSVAAIPEGLPAILTVTLAIGVQRMAARNAIIRRLPAVETLGSVSIICSDKTGTLTRNEMTVTAIATADGAYSVSGVGYDPHGGFSAEGAELSELPEPLSAVIRAAILCNDSQLRQADGRWVVEGDPMEGALLMAGLKAGFSLDLEAKERPRKDVIPFESEHRFMATLHHDHEGRGFVFVKGAPERLLDMCAAQRTGGGDVPVHRMRWETAVEEMTSRGQRVLAVATRAASPEHRELRFSDVDGGLTLLGLLGLIDPPREEAIEAVRECQSAGIRVKMITGDHAGTARAIAAQLGLRNSADVMTGRDLDAIDDPALPSIAVGVDVFARTSPEHKLRLVMALQEAGHAVAMTGDGVNDAPALKRSDVGVAMGLKGTDAAKEAAEMVLADDNFASIAEAVREGRAVYDNLKKSIIFLLPINGGESLAIVAAILAGSMLPITPLQILWVNMVSSVVLAMTLAFEPMESDVMKRPPRRLDAPMLSTFVLWRIALVSALFVGGIFGMFNLALWRGAEVAEARTLAVNTLVAMEIFYLFSVRYLRAPSLTVQGILGTRPVLIAVAIVVGLQFVFTYAPFMQRWFETRPVSLFDGMLVVAVAVGLFFVLELEKLGRQRFGLATAH